MTSGPFMSGRAKESLRFDLRPIGLDAVTCLERLLPRGGRGFIIEKNEEGRRRAWIGVGPIELLSVQRGRAVSETTQGKRILPGNPVRNPNPIVMGIKGNTRKFAGRATKDKFPILYKIKGSTKI